VILVGEVSKKRVLFRSKARRGDLIFVTGLLGAAAEGLKLLQDGFRLLGDTPQSLIIPPEHRDSRFVTEAILCQMDPPLWNDAAQKLARSGLVHSMIDLSDGLGSDLQEICRESKVGARIELARLPIAPAVLHWEAARNLNPRNLALQGGEDYHLLFTASASSRNKLRKLADAAKFSLFEIGKIVGSAEGVYTVDEDGRKAPLEPGYQHFAS
jgi:thiamine-monophosphate kinase